ncbi:hypothetical protein [Streptomyces sp. RG80]
MAFRQARAKVRGGFWLYKEDGNTLVGYGSFRADGEHLVGLNCKTQTARA